VITQHFASRATIGVIVCEVDEVVLAELSLRFHAGRCGLRQRHGDVGIFTSLDLLATVIATIGDRIELVDAENRFSLRRHVGKLCPIRAAVRHLMRDDEVVFRIHRDLHVVAHDAPDQRRPGPSAPQPLAPRRRAVPHFSCSAKSVAGGEEFHTNAGRFRPGFEKAHSTYGPRSGQTFESGHRAPAKTLDCEIAATALRAKEPPAKLSDDHVGAIPRHIHVAQCQESGPWHETLRRSVAFRPERDQSTCRL
jgi:hypothetical protein